jgi:hypothetical protein
MSCLYQEQRRVLLIDADVRRRNLRTNVFRNLEFEVHTATDLPAATPFWRSIPYDLILFADPQHESIAEWILQIRQNYPNQRIGLLIGPPNYIQEVNGSSGKPRQGQRRRTSSSPLPPLAQPAASQWQRTISSLVNDWTSATEASLGLTEEKQQPRAVAV